MICESRAAGGESWTIRRPGRGYEVALDCVPPRLADGPSCYCDAHGDRETRVAGCEPWTSFFVWQSLVVGLSNVALVVIDEGDSALMRCVGGALSMVGSDDLCL